MKACGLTLFRKQTGVKIGKIRQHLFKEEVLTSQELNHHVHIVGASGFGKSVLMGHILKDRILNKQGLLFIDLKGDRETIFKYTQIAAVADRLADLHIFSLAEPKISVPYNMIKNGTATQIRDRIIQSFIWSEEYYKNQSSSFLLKILMGLCYLRDAHGEELNFIKLLTLTRERKLVENLRLRCEGAPIKIKLALEECFQFLATPENQKSLMGLRAQLESLCLSDFGEAINPDGPGIDLFEVIASGKIVLLFLDSRRYGETAQTIGRLILQDLKAASSRIDSDVPQVDRKPFLVMIDEFADLAQEDFVSFLDRARSAKIGVCIAHQELSDLKRISPEFAARVMGNTATLYAFLQKNPESAEIISGMAGTRLTKKTTEQTERMLFLDMPTGKKSVREVEEFNIHPNVIKSLGVGMCVAVKKFPFSRSHIVDVNYGD